MPGAHPQPFCSQGLVASGIVQGIYDLLAFFAADLIVGPFCGGIFKRWLLFIGLIGDADTLYISVEILYVNLTLLARCLIDFVSSDHIR